MLKTYKYRIYPTNEQKVLIRKHFDACRFVYNLAMETKQTAYLGTKYCFSSYELINQLTELKKQESWLMEVNSQSLQYEIRKVESAYRKYFKKKAGYPNFKKKKNKQSFSIPEGTKINFLTEKIKIYKFNDGIRCVFHSAFKGKIKTVTITKTPTGKYFASVLVDNGEENPKPKKIKEKTTIGIDLGLKHFAITSNGDKFDNPKFLKNSIQRLAVLQRRLSRKKKGSANRNKARHKVALLHEKIANQRKDFLHKLSSKLISDNQTICVEDLAVSNMVKNRKLARSISDVGWGEFVRQLKYKSEWHGKNFIQIGRFEPSSKTCSNCGEKNEVLSLHDREWACANCGMLHDRDINAAKNIKAFALKNSPRGTRGEPVELPTLVGAVKQECVYFEKCKSIPCP